jgi:hypothetical protein
MLETNICEHRWPREDLAKLQEALDEKIYYRWALAPFGFNFIYMETNEYDPSQEESDGKFGGYVWAVAHYIKIGDEYIITNIEKHDEFDDAVQHSIMTRLGLYK